MRRIELNEAQLSNLVTTAVKNILREGIFEDFLEAKHKEHKEHKKHKKDKKDKGKPEKKKSQGLANQAKQALRDPKIDMAEVVRELQDDGLLPPNEDSARSMASKISRGERPMPPGFAAATINHISSD